MLARGAIQVCFLPDLGLHIQVKCSRENALLLTYIMPFKSRQPDIHLPSDLTIWDWLFDSPSSSVNRYSASQLRGYSNGLTGERLNYAQVRDVTTSISTALVKKCGLKRGEVVAIFSPNNIWYPVAMVFAKRSNWKACR